MRAGLKTLRRSVRDDGSGEGYPDPPRVNAVRKAEAWGQGEASRSLSGGRRHCGSRDNTSRDNDGLKRRLAPSSTARSPGQGPTPAALCGGLVSYALSTAPPLSMAAKTVQRVMMEMGGETRNSGLARGREPDGTDDRLPKKEKSEWGGMK